MATLPPEAAFMDPAPIGVVNHADALATWSRIGAQARRLTAMARIGPDDGTDLALAERIAAPSPHAALVQQGIEDIAAMLDSGMAALDTLSARGQDAAAPALALWIEYHAARSAIAAVLGLPLRN